MRIFRIIIHYIKYHQTSSPRNIYSQFFIPFAFLTNLFFKYQSAITKKNNNFGFRASLILLFITLCINLPAFFGSLSPAIIFFLEFIFHLKSLFCVALSCLFYFLCFSVSPFLEFSLCVSPFLFFFSLFFFFFMIVYPSFFQSMYLSVCLYDHLSVSLCLFVCLSLLPSFSYSPTLSFSFFLSLFSFFPETQNVESPIQTPL